MHIVYSYTHMYMCIHTWNYTSRYNTPPKSNRLFKKNSSAANEKKICFEQKT